MPSNPLVEVFGYPVGNMSDDAVNHRSAELCPYGNPSGEKCTKYSVTEPLGVCSVLDGSHPVITCPVRLRQDKLFLVDAAQFFFPGKKWIALTEARLHDANGKSAGNIDVVLAVLDEEKRVVDFGAVEIQAVYISGNVGQAFKHYMKDPQAHQAMTWPAKGYPNPDYLSSSRKRLAPQLLFKGNILHAWGKKLAVVVQKGFYDQLPTLPEVEKHNADLAWLIYDLRYEVVTERYKLHLVQTKYTTFDDALRTITQPQVGDVRDFLKYLEAKIQRGALTEAPNASSLEPTVEPLPSDLPIRE
jgi:hypothetical protein